MKGRLIFDFLYSKGYAKDRIFEVSKLKLEELLTFLFQLIEVINNCEFKSENGLKFLSSKELSGHPFPCSDLDCRIRNIEELCYFSALYSDEVWIVNPFEKYLHFENIGTNVHQQIIEDLIILYSYRPLIENNIIKFTDSKIHFCRDCFHNYLQISPEKFNKKIEDFYNFSYDLFLNNISCNIKKNIGSGATINLKSSISGLLCQNGLVLNTFDARKLPKVLKDSYKQNKKIVSKTKLEKSGLINYILDNYFNDYILQELFYNINGTTFLSNRELDKVLFSYLNKNYKNSKIENINKGIKFTMPFINNCSLDSIMNIRINEGDAFLNYRNSMNNLISSKKELTDSELKDFVNDEINHQLVKIEAIIRKNKKHLVSEFGKNILLGSLAVAVSTFTGVFPDSLKNAILNMGMFQSGKEFIENAKKLIFSEYNHKENNYYFIYKIQQANK